MQHSPTASAATFSQYLHRRLWKSTAGMAKHLSDSLGSSIESVFEREIYPKFFFLFLSFKQVVVEVLVALIFHD